MPTAITAIFGADNRPMEAAFAESEVMARRFGKTISDVNASENAQLLANSARLKQMISMRQDAARYAMTAAGGEMTSRQMNVADQESWLIKLAAAKGISVETLKAQQAMKAEQLAARGLSSDLSNASGHLHGISTVIRESLVIVRETLAGRWNRIPGSISILIQALRGMRAELGLIGGLFTLTGFLATAAVGAIIASFFIWHERVKSLTEDLTGLQRVDLPKPDISAVSAYEQAWRRVKEAIAEASDLINSANAQYERGKNLLDQSQDSEKQLLEVQKEKEMLAAGADPAARAAIRQKYLQQEHDLEVQQQQEQMDLQAKHIQALQDEANAKLQAGAAIKVSSEKEDDAIEETLKKQVELNNARDKGKHGEEIEGSSRLEKDQALVEQLLALKNARSGVNTGAIVGGVEAPSFSATEQAQLEAAQGRIAQAQADKQRLDDYERTRKDRDAARTEQKRLYDEAAKAGADKIKAAADYNAALALNSRILADNDKLRAAQADLEDQQEGLKSGSPESRRAFDLNSTQRVGSYAATPPSWGSVVNSVKMIEKHTEAMAKTPTNRPVGERGPRVSGRFHGDAGMSSH